MPAKPSGNKTVEIKIRPPIQIAKYLDQLIKTGLYGNSRAEVVVYLVRDEIKKLRSDGEFKK